jgi:Flp pilus assembly protein TadD
MATPPIYVSVASEKELQRFTQESGASRRVVWVDWAYREALHLKAFVHAAQKDYATALEFLKLETQIAPYCSIAHVERGYALNALGRPTEAVAEYEIAVALAREVASSAGTEAMALRGLGFTLIELNELDRAEAALRDSLKLDPQNEVAKNELLYLRRLQQRR